MLGTCLPKRGELTTFGSLNNPRYKIKQKKQKSKSGINKKLIFFNIQSTRVKRVILQ